MSYSAWSLAAHISPVTPQASKLPKRMFDLPKLLSQGGLPGDFPAAHVPPGITSIPKPFQLQVSCEGLPLYPHFIPPMHAYTAK